MVMTYKDSGVDIEQGNKLVDYIRAKNHRTDRNVLGGVGGFGALYGLKNLIKDIEEPVLVSSTDGVGTKLLVAQAANVHNTIGIDLVAMCVNDILTQGAIPLFFLDYIATSKLEQEVLKQVLDGIIQGCTLGEISLVGGETAEMPDMYTEGKYDLAGFAVGIIDRKNTKPADVMVGDVLIGIPSSGYHSNGYSLLRKLGISHNFDLGERTFGEALLTPTKIYTKSMKLINSIIKAAAHITGGGIKGNLPRVLPDGIGAMVDLSSWNLPREFSVLMEYGVVLDEILAVFNNGIGMICVVDSKDVGKVTSLLSQIGEDCFIIGELKHGSGVEFRGQWQ